MLDRLEQAFERVLGVVSGEEEGAVARAAASLLDRLFLGGVEVGCSVWSSCWRVDGRLGAEPFDICGSRLEGILDRLHSSRLTDPFLLLTGEAGIPSGHGVLAVRLGQDRWLAVGGACSSWLGWSKHRETGESLFHEDVTARLEVLRDLARTVVRLQDAEALLTFDPETGLLNRAAIIGHIEQAIARAKRDGKPFTVARIDVVSADDSDIKRVQVPSAVLKGLAQVFAETIRREDFVARVGPNAFAFLFLGGDGQEAPAALDRILRNVRKAEIMAGTGLELRAGAMTQNAPVASAIEALNDAEAMLALERERSVPRSLRRA
jgi:diguanylate cyclase (GGDEF)-like protein